VRHQPTRDTVRTPNPSLVEAEFAKDLDESKPGPISKGPSIPAEPSTIPNPVDDSSKAPSSPMAPSASADAVGNSTGVIPDPELSSNILLDADGCPTGSGEFTPFSTTVQFYDNSIVGYSEDPVLTAVDCLVGLPTHGFRFVALRLDTSSAMKTSTYYGGQLSEMTLVDSVGTTFEYNGFFDTTTAGWWVLDPGAFVSIDNRLIDHVDIVFEVPEGETELSLIFQEEVRPISLSLTPLSKEKLKPVSFIDRSATISLARRIGSSRTPKAISKSDDYEFVAVLYSMPANVEIVEDDLDWVVRDQTGKEYERIGFGHQGTDEPYFLVGKQIGGMTCPSGGPLLQIYVVPRNMRSVNVVGPNGEEYELPSYNARMPGAWLECIVIVGGGMIVFGQGHEDETWLIVE